MKAHLTESMQATARRFAHEHAEAVEEAQRLGSRAQECMRRARVAEDALKALAAAWGNSPDAVLDLTEMTIDVLEEDDDDAC